MRKFRLLYSIGISVMMCLVGCGAIGLPGSFRNTRDITFVGEFTEADTAELHLAHESTAATTAPAASNNPGGIFRRAF